MYAAKKSLSLLQRGNNRLAPGIWLANIFVPMFGQFDWQGRIVSFFMRVVQVVVRTGVLAIWLVVCLLLFFSWFVIPVVVIYGITYGK